MLDIILCKGNYFKKKRIGGKKLFCIVCRKNRFSMRHPIQSEKIGDAQSCFSCGFLPYFRIFFMRTVSWSILKRDCLTFFFSN